MLCRDKQSAVDSFVDRRGINSLWVENGFGVVENYEYLRNGYRGVRFSGFSRPPGEPIEPHRMNKPGNGILGGR